APLSTGRADLPVVLDSLVRRMLGKQVTDRPSSAGELAQELSTLAAHLRAEPAPSERASTVTLEGEWRAVALLAARLDGYDQLGERLGAAEGGGGLAPLPRVGVARPAGRSGSCPVSEAWASTLQSGTTAGSTTSRATSCSASSGSPPAKKM